MGCPDADLSIVITDDAGIREVNRAWRGKDKATDVLSFSQLEDASAPGLVAVGPDTEALGDVVISAETAARQAPRFGNSFEQEIERLLVHGVLHLLGHDHVHGGPQARRMQREEARLLGVLRRATRSASRPRAKRG